MDILPVPSSVPSNATEGIRRAQNSPCSIYRPHILSDTSALSYLSGDDFLSAHQTSKDSQIDLSYLNLAPITTFTFVSLFSQSFTFPLILSLMRPWFNSTLHILIWERILHFSSLYEEY